MPKQTMHDIETCEQLDSLIESGMRLITNFHAPWAAPCTQMNMIFSELHKTFAEESGINFASVAAEALPQLTSRYKVSTVPTILCFYDKRVVRRFSGADALKLTKMAKWLNESDEEELTRGACEQVTKLGAVTMIMKGSVDNPKCGFSRQMVEILRKEGIVFESFDILQDEVIRQAIKTYADWPTFPMLWSEGRLVGGIDVVRELSENGELVKELERKEEGKGAEGTQQEQVVAEKVQEEAVADAKADAKADSKADAKADAKAKGDAKEEEMGKRLEELTKQSEVMLFMKGNPEQPRCGFSRKIVEVLRREKISFGHFDILQDEDVRRELKKYSDWPTYPQLYSKGQFIGGLDIVNELVESGTLAEQMSGTL